MKRNDGGKKKKKNQRELGKILCKGVILKKKRGGGWWGRRVEITQRRGPNAGKAGVSFSRPPWGGCTSLGGEGAQTDKNE